MNLFTDKDSELFLNKEWLVRIDNANSQPYLFKFHASKGDLRVCILITDTKNVWFEALESKHLARRWRHLNHGVPPFEEDEQESAWRLQTFEKLLSIHTLTAIQESVFSVEDARDADLVIELQTLDHRWRWETYTLGPKTSAEILSTHLILPLLSVTHLAFTSADPVSELSTQDLEQAVDKVARTGRRSQDVHVRQTLSRPRVATTLQRMTAMFNFADPIPPVLSTLDQDIEMAPPHIPAIDSSNFSSITRTHAGHYSPGNMPNPLTHSATSSSTPPVNILTADSPKSASGTSLAPASQPQREPAASAGHKKPADEDSATEPESGGENSVAPQSHRSMSQAPVRVPSVLPGPSSRTFGESPPGMLRAGSSSDSSQPRPPAKKAKLNVVPEDSSDESGDERAKVAAPRSGRGAGVRQPIKRGGRRF